MTAPSVWDGQSVVETYAARVQIRECLALVAENLREVEACLRTISATAGRGTCPPAADNHLWAHFGGLTFCAKRGCGTVMAPESRKTKCGEPVHGPRLLRSRGAGYECGANDDSRQAG